MKDEPNPQPATETPDPLDVMRKVFQEAEFHFEEDDEDRIRLVLALNNLDVIVACWGESGDLAGVLVRLPIRATKEFLARAGEFLHRLNYDAKRKFWEIDYTDGEIRLVAHTDTITGPLTEGLFWSLFQSVTSTVDVTFPYLTSVLSGRMTPEFAADQAEAALQAFWNKGNNPDDKNGTENAGQ